MCLQVRFSSMRGSCRIFSMKTAVKSMKRQHVNHLKIPLMLTMSNTCLFSLCGIIGG